MGRVRGPAVIGLVVAMGACLCGCAAPADSASGQPAAGRVVSSSRASTTASVAPAVTTTPHSLVSVSGRVLSARLSAALRAQRGFHLTVAEGAVGKGFTDDIEFAGNGGEGTFTSPSAGMQLRILSVGADLYVAASDAQWRRTLAYQSDSARKLALISGKYLQVRPHSDDSLTRSFAELAGWANRDTLITMFFGMDSIGQTTFIDRGHTAVGGIDVTRYDAQTGQSPGFELDVAATGPPVPIHVATTAPSGFMATIDFTDYGGPAAVSRPPANQVVQASAIFPEPAR